MQLLLLGLPVSYSFIECFKFICVFGVLEYCVKASVLDRVLDEFNAQTIWHRPACFASPGTGVVETFSVDWHGESNRSLWTTVVHLPRVANNLVTWLNVWCSVVLFARGYLDGWVM